MLVCTTHRSEKEEIMDNFDLQGKALEEIFRDLEQVNRLLGGNQITLSGIKMILEKNPEISSLKIADIGCGNASLLKEVAEFGRRNGIGMELTGIDANIHAIEIAENNTMNYPEIKFLAQNIFSEGFKKMEFDVILCTLTLHHFKDDQIRQLIRLFLKCSKLGVVINDLQRSRLAYYLFQGFSRVFMKNDIARQDGLTSILRSFKEEDLQRYGRNLKVEQKISRRWAFRYQWVLFK